jgi:hypothetical protein
MSPFVTLCLLLLKTKKIKKIIKIIRKKLLKMKIGREALTAAPQHRSNRF